MSAAAPASAGPMPEIDVARIRRWGWWYAAEHLLRNMRAYGGTVLMSAVGSPFLYLLAFGAGIGSLVTGDFGSHGNGIGYFQFIAPALVASAGVQVAAEELSYPVMMGFKWRELYLGMNAAPLTAGQIMTAAAVVPVIRMTVACSLYLGTMALFGGIRTLGGLAVLPVALLTGLAFGMPLMAYSSTLREDRGQFAIMMRVVVLPMTLFSGTMFPLQTLPAWLWWVGWISPLWHGAQLARDAADGLGEPAWLVLVHLVLLAGLAALGFALAVRTARRRLDR